MNRKGWTGLLAINLVVLVATSPARYSTDDTASPVGLSLSPESPAVYIDGSVEAGEAFSSVSLSMSFDGLNGASFPGEISLYLLADGEDLPAEGATPDSVAVVDATFEGDQPAQFDLQISVDQDNYGPFRVLALLDGEAVIDGELSVSASATTSDKKSEGQWVELSEIEVSPADIVLP